MEYSDFTIHFAEVNVQLFNCFTFTMPKQDIGRDDIKICVEYGVPTEDNAVYYNVWAQLSNQSVRAFVHDGVIRSGDPGATVQCIMEDINGSEVFYDTLHQFIEHFDIG